MRNGAGLKCTNKGEGWVYSKLGTCALETVDGRETKGGHDNSQFWCQQLTNWEEPQTMSHEGNNQDALYNDIGRELGRHCMNQLF